MHTCYIDPGVSRLGYGGSFTPVGAVGSQAGLFGVRLCFSAGIRFFCIIFVANTLMCNVELSLDTTCVVMCFKG